MYAARRSLTALGTEAPVTFNDFFAPFVTAVANPDQTPRWKPASQYATK
jgi:hypothetical protein